MKLSFYFFHPNAYDISAVLTAMSYGEALVSRISAPKAKSINPASVYSVLLTKALFNADTSNSPNAQKDIVVGYELTLGCRSNSPPLYWTAAIC